MRVASRERSRRPRRTRNISVVTLYYLFTTFITAKLSILEKNSSSKKVSIIHKLYFLSIICPCIFNNKKVSSMLYFAMHFGVFVRQAKIFIFFAKKRRCRKKFHINCKWGQCPKILVSKFETDICNS